MSRLTPHECRVLGVLVEKAFTTPAQYPLTLNAMVSGANQRSNRNPVLSLSEEDVEAALAGLRAKGLAREVMMSGSRVEKYRHVARETIDVSVAGLVILVELLLRGPQTAGEIRSRASRMHALESLEVVERELEVLIERSEPLVRRLPPAAGSRAARYAQLLCPDLHPVDAGAAPPRPAAPPAEDADAWRQAIEARLERLESELAALRARLGDD